LAGSVVEQLMDGATSPIEAELSRRIVRKEACVAIFGLGYVGLPLAVAKAKAGFQIIGIDQNPNRVASISRGESYIADVDSHALRKLVAQGAIAASADTDCLADVDVVVICVPTPLTKNLTPDLHCVESVTREIALFLRPGQLVALESTTYPGTTEELLLPILETSGLKAEHDFFLVHSPERVDPGNARFGTRNTRKIVGGVGPASLRVGALFYGQTIKNIVPVSSTQVAELAKVFENTFRAVNIALVNEMALLCDPLNLNVWEVLDAAFTKPFGIMPFYPGPGVGGHCVPVDPHYLEWKAKEVGFNTHFIALAGEINRMMPGFVRQKALRVLNTAGLPGSGSKILVLGAAFKRDVGDWRESPSLEVMRLLLRDGAEVSYHDPLVPRVATTDLTLTSVALTEHALSSSDLVIIATDHSAVDYDWVVQHSRHVLDTRNATRKVTKRRERITLL